MSYKQVISTVAAFATLHLSLGWHIMLRAWMQQTDRNGQLSKFLNPNLTPPEKGIAGVEGWILGVG